MAAPGGCCWPPSATGHHHFQDWRARASAHVRRRRDADTLACMRVGVLGARSYVRDLARC